MARHHRSRPVGRGSAIQGVSGRANTIGKFGEKIFSAPVAAVATGIDFSHTPNQPRTPGDTHVDAPAEPGKMRIPMTHSAGPPTRGRRRPRPAALAETPGFAVSSPRHDPSLQGRKPRETRSAFRPYPCGELGRLTFDRPSPLSLWCLVTGAPHALRGRSHGSWRCLRRFQRPGVRRRGCGRSRRSASAHPWPCRAWCRDRRVRRGQREGPRRSSSRPTDAGTAGELDRALSSHRTGLQRTNWLHQRPDQRRYYRRPASMVVVSAPTPRPAPQPPDRGSTSARSTGALASSAGWTERRG